MLPSREVAVIKGEPNATLFIYQILASFCLETGLFCDTGCYHRKTLGDGSRIVYASDIRWIMWREIEAAEWACLVTRIHFILNQAHWSNGHAALPCSQYERVESRGSSVRVSDTVTWRFALDLYLAT